MTSCVVLVVDDEEEIRALFTRFLKRRGFDVYTAGDLSSTRKLIEQINPQIMFLDINLPDGNGLEELKRTGHDPSYPKVILMSAFDHPEARKEADNSGALYFLGKPFDISTLDFVVSKFCTQTQNYG